MLNVKFYRLEITGVKQPLLTIKGIARKEVKQFLIVAKNQDEVFIDLDEVTCPIKLVDVHMQLALSDYYELYYILEDGSKHLIETFKYNLISRIKNKIQGKQDEHYIQKLSKKEQDKHIENPNFFELCDDEAYNQWIMASETFDDYTPMEYEPLISFVMPVYNVASRYLKAVLDSMLNQVYPNYEICIADDCSSNKETLKVLKEYETKYEQVKIVYRQENGHISNATNSALEIAKGEFIALVDNDDLLSPFALNEVVKCLNKDQTLDFIYSDEDKMDQKNKRSKPVFKPDYSPITLIGGNYLCHLSVIRKSLIDQVGGFTVGVEGAQDFDLFLRILQQTDKVAHIPHILYHWRMIDGSTAQDSSNKNYAGLAGKKALENLYGNRKEVFNIIHTHYLTLEKEFKNKIKLIIYNFDEDKWQSSKQHLVLNYDLIVVGDGQKIVDVINEQPDDAMIVLMDGVAKLEIIGYLAFLCEPLTYANVAISCGAMCDEKYILNASYNVLSEKGLMANIDTPVTSWGQYGSMAVPRNVSMTNFDIVAFKKEDVEFNDDTSLSYNIADNVLRNIAKGNQVVFTPLAIAMKGHINSITTDELELLKNQYLPFFENDINYNPNFSKDKIFMIDR